MIHTSRISATPNAWTPGELLVAASSSDESRLSTSKPTAPSSGAGPQRLRRDVGLGEQPEHGVEEHHVGGDADEHGEQHQQRGRARCRCRSSRAPPASTSRRTPDTATLTHQHDADDHQREQVAQLAAHEAGLLLAAALEHHQQRRRACRTASRGRRTAHRARPSRPTVPAESSMVSGDSWPSPSPISPGRTPSIALDQVRPGVGVDLRDPADDEERERQDREERQEREVGHRPGLQAALDVAVVLRPSGPGGRRRDGALAAPRPVR